jgi:hypothetical protein
MSERNVVETKALDMGCIESIFKQDIESYSSLFSDCEQAFTSKNSNGDAYSTGSTFFIKSISKPRCLLEQMALEVFHFHAERLNIPYNKKKSGAEWWTQCIDSRDDIGFHWDRDYGLEERTGDLKYPNLGTVTYLTDFGGPTLVMPITGQENKQSIEKKFTTIMLSKPRKGKHMYFDGKLLHAAPGDYDGNTEDGDDDDDDDDVDDDNNEDSEDDESDTGVTRVTFLVNIWLDHVPEQSSSFPKDDIRHMGDISTWKNKDKDLTSISSLLEFKTKPDVIPEILDMEHMNSTIRTWKFHDLLRSYAIKIPMNTEIIKLIEAKDGAHFFNMSFTKQMPAMLEDLGEVSESEGENGEEEIEDDEEEENTEVVAKRRRIK